MKIQKKNLVFQNLANLFTLIRLLATILLLLCMRILYSSNYDTALYRFYVLLTGIVWVSDYLDGKIARKLGSVSRFGSVFDVTVDFIFIITLHIQLVLYQLIPSIILIIIIERLINYMLTSNIISKKTKNSFEFIRDTLGRFVVALFYIIPIITCSLEKFTMKRKVIVNLLIFILLILSIIASIRRIKYIKTEKKGGYPIK